MSAEKHIIKKAIVEVYVPSADNAFELQNKTLHFFKAKVCPLIEKIASKYSTDEIIRIDKMKIDIENFDPNDFNDAGLVAIEEQIEKQLMKLIAEEKQADFSDEILAVVKKISKEKADEELFFHVLKTGSLPWWAKTEEKVVLEVLAHKILLQPSTSFKQELTKALTVSSVRKRIAYKLSPDNIEKIIAIVYGSPANVLQHIHKLVDFIKDSAIFTETLRTLLYEYVLNYSTSSNSTLRLFISEFVKKENDFSLAEGLYKLTEKVNVKNAVSEEFSIIVKQALADSNVHFSGDIKKMFSVKDVQLFFDLKEKEQKEKEQKAKEQIEKEVSHENKKSKDTNQREEAISKKETEYSNQTEPVEEAGDYFIKNAGVIILTPYLSPLFKELELYDGKTFISEEAKERAAYVLQYLATGVDEVFEEHEMVLNKILCGIQIDVPLTLQFVISEKEKEECLNLLQAVADNWTALKGTSGTGMRDAFFMRDGILEQQANGWNLKVEKITVDILLDKLPWGISILQMPWSKEMIFVSW